MAKCIDAYIFYMNLMLYLSKKMQAKITCDI